MLRVAFFSFLSLFLAAQAPQAAPRTSTKPKAEAEKPKEDNVIGRVGNHLYRESDFLDFLPMIVQPAQLEQVKNNTALQKQYHRSFLESMLILNKAIKDGIDKTPDYNAKLARLTKTLLMQEMVAQYPDLQKTPTPTEEQIKAYYEENQSKFKARDTATARHILVAVRNNESETDKLTDENAKAKINKIKAELIGGKSWEDAAKQYSDDPGSKETGGRYENFNPAQMVPEFAEAVRTQEIGKIGEPVKTQFGYHIVLVESRRIGETQAFSEARAAAQRELIEKMRNDAWISFIDSLKTEIGFADANSPADELKVAPTPKAAPKKATAAKPSGGKK